MLKWSLFVQYYRFCHKFGHVTCLLKLLASFPLPVYNFACLPLYTGNPVCSFKHLTTLSPSLSRWFWSWSHCLPTVTSQPDRQSDVSLTNVCLVRVCDETRPHVVVVSSIKPEPVNESVCWDASLQLHHTHRQTRVVNYSSCTSIKTKHITSTAASDNLTSTVSEDINSRLLYVHVVTIIYRWQPITAAWHHDREFTFCEKLLTTSCGCSQSDLPPYTVTVVLPS